MTQPSKILIGALLFSVACLAQTRPAPPEPASISVQSTKPEPKEAYAGIETCAGCHPSELKQFNKTQHAVMQKPGPNVVTGCETCHGPGAAHADAMFAAGGDAAKVAAGKKLIFAFNSNPKANAERCMGCHNTNNDQKEFGRSTHARHGVACQDCHSTHLVEAVAKPKDSSMPRAQGMFFSIPRLPEEQRWLKSSLLRKEQPALCAQCHGNIMAQFALPSHHKVPEGLMKCTDCHNTHGTSNRATLRQSGWETCTGCHVEKRGPFVFEHSAVKVEGCTACHVPHGSVNKLLQVRREERLLCLSCHVDPSAANVPHGRLGFQTRGDCTRCHSSIHGSNFDPSFLH